jgi:hypothetical protein
VKQGSGKFADKASHSYDLKIVLRHVSSVMRERSQQNVTVRGVCIVTDLTGQE